MIKNLYWHITRLLGFIIIAVFNTILLRPEDVGGWKNYLGYVIWIFAVYDLYLLIRHFIKKNIEKNKKGQ